MQKRRGYIYHVNDVSVYLDRQRGEGFLVERTSWRPDLVVSSPSTGVLNVRKAKSVPLLVKNEDKRATLYYLWF